MCQCLVNVHAAHVLFKISACQWSLADRHFTSVKAAAHFSRDQSRSFMSCSFTGNDKTKIHWRWLNITVVNKNQANHENTYIHKTNIINKWSVHNVLFPGVCSSKDLQIKKKKNIFFLPSKSNANNWTWTDTLQECASNSRPCVTGIKAASDQQSVTELL